MSEINDGGPAFPVEVDSTQPDGMQTGNTRWQAYGMSLRDYMATHADIGNVDELSLGWGEKLLGRACPGSANPITCYQWWADYRAALRYMEADAMLKAREGAKP